jgi:histidinol-phosphatase (PHP family)
VSKSYLSQPLTSDFHLHDSGSHDGSGSPSEYAEAAKKKGITSIAITNHVELFDKDAGRYDVAVPRDVYRLQKVHDEILRARENYPDINILFGIEVENNPVCYPQMEEILETFQFDIVIGSVHIVEGIPISATYCKDYLKSRDPDWLYNAFYEEMANFVEWGRFDILGHGDIIRRYMMDVHREFKPLYPKNLLKPVFEMMRSKNQGIEINSSGFFQAPQSPYPDIEMVDLAMGCGITKFTTGSDAHKPGDVGRGFDMLATFFNENRDS